MKPRAYFFPVVMCLLTVATAARYAQIVSLFGLEYNFVVQTNEEGLSRIKADLAAADLHSVQDSEIEDGVFRITVRCPPDKINLLSMILSRKSDRRPDK